MMFLLVKSVVVKDSAENPLGEQVLNEHLLNLRLGKVRINRGSALLMEVLKRLSEGWIILHLGLNPFGDTAP